MKEARVEEVNSDPMKGNPPKVNRPDFGYGVQSKEAAREWARRKGYDVVYWWRARQRVYGELPQKRVDVLAEQIAKRSDALLHQAEGQ